jgi:ATP-dependent RNA helicase DeaD
MGLDPKLIEGIKLMGIKDPTPIQAKCIPHLKAGKDLVGQSLTGSGKTAAFGLPILEKIVPGAGLQALIITPTRELCVQVRDNIESMARYLPINVKSVYGGVGFFQQIEDLKIAEIIVATPGRLLDHMGRRNVDLRTIKFVVLDEADRMFDMGFEDDIDKILRQTPNSRQTIMFSATMPKAAQHIANKYLKNPVYVQEQLQVDRSLMTQVFYSVKKEDKFSLLVHLLKTKTSGPAIVFCGTKREVDRVARNLRKEKVDALPVHGDLTQGKRQFAVNSFKLGKIDVLVATDVAARGLDIKDVSHVYNYDVPRTAEEYTHRIGRTARAGKKGDAVTLLSERDYQNFNKILKFGKQNIKQEATPIFERIEFKKDFHHGEDFGGEDASEQGRGRREDLGAIEEIDLVLTEEKDQVLIEEVDHLDLTEEIDLLVQERAQEEIILKVHLMDQDKVLTQVIFQETDLEEIFLMLLLTKEIDQVTYQEHTILDQEMILHKEKDQLM